MLPTHEKIDATIFDVEKNDGLAKQIFHAYYRTPDASGEIYRTFPEFFLIKPDVLDDSLLAFNKQELPLIANARSRATSRTGYLGVSKYFDENFAYHWIKIAAYPVVLSDLNTHQQDEFFYLLNKFVQFTQQNPNVYGDLTADAASDNAVALMLRSIAQQARAFEEKLQHYPLHMLLSFDASWPTAQVKTLLAALEINEQSWNHLFLEHLRYVMRKNKGLVKSHSSAPIVPSDVAPNPPPSAAQTAAVVVAAPLASAATDERVAPQSLDMVAT
ncbi:MAG: hypothetical protein PXX73_04300, partial [Sideroxydans sp.]|nr:hypothetical protein [Sideroxydans sp.]